MMGSAGWSGCVAVDVGVDDDAGVVAAVGGVNAGGSGFGNGVVAGVVAGVEVGSEVGSFAGVGAWCWSRRRGWCRG